MTEWIISSSVLIVAMLLLRSLLRGKINPRIQYALWAIVLARLLMPFPLFQSALSVQNLHEEVRERPAVNQVYQAIVTPIAPTPGGQVSDQSTVTQQPQQSQQSPVSTPSQNIPTVSEPAVQRSVSLTDVLIQLWVGGMLLMALWMTGCNLRFSNRLRRSRKPLDIAASPLPVYRTGAAETPCLFGLFRPAVYLTPEAVENEQLRRYVLTHEITHYRQFDHVWAVLRAVVLVLHWYNPLVWIAFRASRQDGEMACDEGTLKELGEEHRGNYGRTLIGLATGRTFRASMVTATSMGGTKRAMKERIVILMKNPKTALMTMVSLILVCVLIVGCTFTGAVDKPTEPEETVPVETTEPMETTEPIETTEPVETTTPIETVPLDYTPLTDAQIAQVNEAFASTWSYEIDHPNGQLTCVESTPISCFFTCYYEHPSQMNLKEFLRQFSAEGIVEDWHEDVTEEEFDDIRVLDGFSFPDKNDLKDMPVPIHKYPSSTVDAVIYHYTGVHLDELEDANGRGDVFYSEQYDAYYNHTSDFGPGYFNCIDGRIYDGYVELYSAQNTVLILVEQDGRYLITSHVPRSWMEPTELTAYEIDQVNKAFASVIEDEYGTMGSSPISCFFTSYYADPTQIDLLEFLRYFSATGIVDNWHEDVTEEEFDYIRKLDGFLFAEKTSLMDLPVPIHKYTSRVVNEVIYRYTGIQLNQLEDADGRGEAFYCAKYDSYYNFTSDFGPGFFICVGGVHYGDRIELYSDNAVLTLVPQFGDSGPWVIYSHLPKE